MRAVDLFCGYGGATAGMLAAGLTVEAAYDRDEAAIAAHKQWHPTVACENRDIGTVGPGELAGRFVWASPSCKPWSTANRRRRGQDHPEYYPLDRLVTQARHATVLVIENVAGLVTEKDGQAELKRMERALHGRPYSVHVLPSNEYGVPQLRRRAFIVVGAFVMWQRGERVPTEAAVMATERTSNFRATHNFDRGERPQHRTVAECAALQGVPVPEGVPERTAFRLIGNAVPPLLGESVCRQVLASLAVPA